MEILIDDLVRHVQTTLGSRLLGLYLFGSSVAGDFDVDISDIDLLAVVAQEVDAETFSALDQMHRQFVRRYPLWDDRLDIVYIGADALRAWGMRPVRMAVISPGDDFARQEADPGWLMNWYSVQEQGETLAGPPPATFIPSITRERYVATVRDSALHRLDWLEGKHERKAQAYVILTMCRALYAVRNGEQVSKRRAAEWAAAEMPEHAELIRAALSWRAAWREHNIDHAVTLPETRCFVQLMTEQIAAE